MGYLLLVSVVWAFSFSLIKNQLTGLNPGFVAFVRMALSMLFFLPLLRPRAVTARVAWQLIALGAIQYGMMYVFYIAAFAHLPAHVVALFTVFTPLFVVLVDDGWERRWRPKNLLAALIAIAGATCINTASFHMGNVWRGFLLIQASNLCFAIGQVWYKRLDLQDSSPTSTFGFAYFGGVLVTGGFVLVSKNAIPAAVSFSQLATLAYLGVVASGLCFYLWNLGARRTSTGVLAVFNNIKIPLGVLVSLVIFSEQTNLPRLGIAATLMTGAWWLAHHTNKSPKSNVASS